MPGRASSPSSACSRIYCAACKRAKRQPRQRAQPPSWPPRSKRVNGMFCHLPLLAARLPLPGVALKYKRSA
eukprot:scaffold134222_cov26-Tisochrysis_lutea.AAC.1